MDNDSLAHSKWNCKYHIVFAPKCRRQIIYGQIKADVGRILRILCERKRVEIIEANACKDHIHMLVSIPPKLSVAQFIGYLKGKSSLMIFDRHANLKYKYGNSWLTDSYYQYYWKISIIIYILNHYGIEFLIMFIFIEFKYKKVKQRFYYYYNHLVNGNRCISFDTR